MIHLGIPAWEIVLRLAAVYLSVLVGLRLMGKRELGRMTILAQNGRVSEENLRHEGVVPADAPVTRARRRIREIRRRSSDASSRRFHGTFGPRLTLPRREIWEAFAPFPIHVLVRMPQGGTR